jgi:DNA recombination protein RmuC
VLFRSSEDLRQIRISTEKVVKRGERIEELELEETEDSDEALPPPPQRLSAD